jgi:Fe-S oxidoreductase
VLRRALAALGEPGAVRGGGAAQRGALAAEVRAGRDVVVAQPTCAYVIKRDYPIYVAGPDADLVAAHTYDPAEYLMKRHKNAGRRLRSARRVSRARGRQRAR